MKSGNLTAVLNMHKCLCTSLGFSALQLQRLAAHVAALQLRSKPRKRFCRQRQKGQHHCVNRQSISSLALYCSASSLTSALSPSSKKNDVQPAVHNCRKVLRSSCVKLLPVGETWRPVCPSHPNRYRQPATPHCLFQRLRVQSLHVMCRIVNGPLVERRCKCCSAFEMNFHCGFRHVTSAPSILGELHEYMRMLPCWKSRPIALKTEASAATPRKWSQ